MKIERTLKQYGAQENWILPCDCCGRHMEGTILMKENFMFCSESCVHYFFKH